MDQQNLIPDATLHAGRQCASGLSLKKAGSLTLWHDAAPAATNTERQSIVIMMMPARRNLHWNVARRVRAFYQSAAQAMTAQMHRTLARDTLLLRQDARQRCREIRRARGQPQSSDQGCASYLSLWSTHHFWVVDLGLQAAQERRMTCQGRIAPSTAHSSSLSQRGRIAAQWYGPWHKLPRPALSTTPNTLLPGEKEACVCSVRYCTDYY
ncbi:hypothetical protein K431DRAFT_34352 [Polychaeton citri CBS 116435]|uniref:Uncharacterized protein n=1 Tax=Polychaeton citri CBS 116435 TaxID=1314669 RepID=A0A9P4UP83_9PEZI|nr:hypothetical protein K431DRAFT_34352 [Polychaeton citri CBS 116435]